MKITMESQFKLGTKYYYADVMSPNLEHQEDCVCVFEVTYQDISEEYKKKYGLDPDPKNLLKTTGIVYCEGRNKARQRVSTMGLEWIRSRDFYTTIDEACSDAIIQTFEYYKPFGI